MIDSTKVLAIIPARGGSKGVPGKNIRIVGNKPLIAWTIEAALCAAHIGRAIVSSDDPAIIDVSREHGCEVPFIRDTQLAGDKTPTIEVVLDAIERCPGYDWVVLLQPTSPLRTAADIDNAVAMCITANASSCVSVAATQESPYWMFTLIEGDRLKSLLPNAAVTRRQDLPAVYSLNGAIYVARTEWIKREKKFVGDDTIAYVMPAERSIDIDTESDLLHLKLLLEN